MACSASLKEAPPACVRSAACSEQASGSMRMASSGAMDFGTLWIAHTILALDDATRKS